MNTSNDDVVFMAWRDSEAYAVPMTEEGEKKALARFNAFKRGWEYCEFFKSNGHPYKKDHDEYLDYYDEVQGSFDFDEE